MKRYPILLCAYAFAAGIAIGQTTPNPYCVSGANWTSSGVMVNLQMPGAANDETGSLGYIWDTLQTTNVANMVRPKRYWEYVGVNADRIQGYDHTTASLTHPAEFGAWIDANPGKIWIIGNEPNLIMQDGLSTAEYAEMYYVCRNFILSHDPTARFAVGALAADASVGSLNANKNWWNDTLSIYKTNYGVDMPIDIWNCHCYASVGELDPDRIVADFFEGFHEYVNTVSGGMYAGKPIWCTEFGVAMWVHPLHFNYVAEFIDQLCPRLENSGYVDRFFWFIGPWSNWDPLFQDISLLYADKTMTPPGESYSYLANHVPNAIPPAPTTPLPATEDITSDFETTQDPWRIMAGDWMLDNGAFRQTRMSGKWGLRSHLPGWYTDVFVEVDMKINAANSTLNWAALNLRGGTVWEGSRLRPYLIFLRQDGAVGLHNPIDGTVVEIQNVVSDTSIFHRVGARIEGYHIDVFVDGTHVIEWVDPNQRYDAGFVSLEAGMTDCSFDNAGAYFLHTPDLDHDGDVDQADFGVFQTCVSGAGMPQPSRYCQDAQLDDDDDVDDQDLGILLNCFSGSGIAWNPDCQ